MNPHVFAGNPLDHGDVQRRDQRWLDEQAERPRSRFLPLWQLNVLIRDEVSLRLGWLGPDALAPCKNGVPPVFLGLLDGVAHFAIDVSALDEPRAELHLVDGWRFEDARTAAPQLCAPMPASGRRAAPRSTGIDATSSAACAASVRRRPAAASCARAPLARPSIFPAPTPSPSWWWPTATAAC